MPAFETIVNLWNTTAPALDSLLQHAGSVHIHKVTCATCDNERSMTTSKDLINAAKTERSHSLICCFSVLDLSGSIEPIKESKHYLNSNAIIRKLSNFLSFKRIKNKNKHSVLQAKGDQHFMISCHIVRHDRIIHQFKTILSSRAAV